MTRGTGTGTPAFRHNSFYAVVNGRLHRRVPGGGLHFDAATVLVVEYYLGHV